MTTAAKSAAHDELAIPPPAPRTPSGIDVPLLATSDMVREPDPGQPAQFPFTRGIFPDGFRGRLWTIRQYSGFGTAEDSMRATGFCSTRARRDFRSLWICRRSAATIPMIRWRRPEVGKVGVSISNLSRDGDPFRRHRSFEDFDVFHDQRYGRDHLCDVLRLRRQEGRAAREANRHHPERYPEGIRRARDLDLPGAPLDAPDRGHDPVLQRCYAALQSDIDRRRACARCGIDRGRGDGLHPCQRSCLCGRAAASRRRCRRSSPSG